jgi:hypothetical protein
MKTPNAGLQLRRAISIQAEGMRFLENLAIAPSAARLCWAAAVIVVYNFSHDLSNLKAYLRAPAFTNRICSEDNVMISAAP